MNNRETTSKSTPNLDACTDLELEAFASTSPLSHREGDAKEKTS